LGVNDYGRELISQPGVDNSWKATNQMSYDHLLMFDLLPDVIAYHQATKHHFHAYAPGPQYLDWETQPNPFRRYQGAPLIALEHIPPSREPLYDEAFEAGHVLPQPFTHHSVSQFFCDSLALSAWKQAGESSWALRINPSSGNLHPTEGYLVCGSIAGLSKSPMICHYAPGEHALEQRTEFPLETWRALTRYLPEPVLLIGITSIHWREAWKYGERAYRYCQHDVGHAIAALSLAAAALGWQASLLNNLGADSLSTLLGIGDPQGAEPEEPDCVLAVYPQGTPGKSFTLPSNVLTTFATLPWQGQPNVLSAGHVEWPMLERVAAAAKKPPTDQAHDSLLPVGPRPVGGSAPTSLRQVIFQRRSAVALDGRTSIPRDAFYRILIKTLASPGQFPFNTLYWRPLIHLVLFVHRVQGLDPGLYVLIRNPEQTAALQAAMKPEFDWVKPETCPAGVELYQLQKGDARGLSRQMSCHQSIAADGCFSLGMIAEFDSPLRQYGAWFYPRLFWECGAVGQVLYLEAEAIGIRGTGIGCFFDDPMHTLLGLKSLQYQSLYHFTMGGPVEDSRLRTLPPYPPGLE
jgi:SagB-type dehydrogenase family enzyme